MSTQPLVSVVMSVYNGEKYLSKSIESILNQSFANFEFILIDDGSSDGSKKIMESYKDERIVLISRPNKGLVASLNEGVTKARGQLIARQDDDDVSHPARLAEEVRYLQEHPEVGLVGSFAQLMTAKGEPVGSYSTPYMSRDLRRRLFLGNTFVHGSIMVRKDLLPKPAYTSRYGPTEDYALWGKLAQLTDIATIPHFLYNYKINEGGVSIFNSREDASLTAAARDELWSKGRFPSDNILAIVKRGRKYRKGPESQAVYAQFLGDQRMLVTSLWQHKHRAAAATTFFALSLLHPRSAFSIVLER
jgi:glycosyltransferase involved in cell wall biosynthesis